MIRRGNNRDCAGGARLRGPAIGVRARYPLSLPSHAPPTRTLRNNPG